MDNSYSKLNLAIFLSLSNIDMDNVDVIFYGKVEGSIFQDRYKVEHLIDKGLCGKVYSVVDLQSENNHQPLVIKVSEQYKLLAKEVKTMSNIWHKDQKVRLSDSDFGEVPKVISYGIFVN